MRRFRFALAVFVALLACGFTTEARAGRFFCRGPYVAPTFAYGNAGYAAGYSTAVTRWGGWCGPRWGGWCTPRWNWCGPRWGCRPWGWGCRPWGWGCTPWYGGTTWGCSDSVFLSVPAGGGATFFSGSLVPYPVWGGWGLPATWVPGPYGWTGYPYGVGLPSGFAPQFGPAGVMPFLGLNASTANPHAGAVVAATPAAAPRPVIAAAPGPAGRPALVRASSPVARLRAARLVAVGDRHLREARGDQSRLTAALDAYRRAAAIAQDQPDIQLRQALALLAVGRDGQADEAIGRAVAIDGRLAATPPRPADGLAAAADPVFGDRPAGSQPPFAVRGAAILREIAAQAGGEEGREVVAVLADRWSRRFDRDLGAIAANPAAAR